MAEPAFYRPGGGATADARARVEAFEGEPTSADERWETSEALAKD